MCPQPRPRPATQTCALTRNWTSDTLVHRLALSPLSHTSQGKGVDFEVSATGCASYLDMTVLNNQGRLSLMCSWKCALLLWASYCAERRKKFKRSWTEACRVFLNRKITEVSENQVIACNVLKVQVEKVFRNNAYYQQWKGLRTKVGLWH